MNEYSIAHFYQDERECVVTLCLLCLKLSPNSVPIWVSVPRTYLTENSPLSIQHESIGK
jgi:hypothetical protein